MFSRLVLVGMVAALGITVPTRMEILGWIKEAHSWTASRLADWDSSRPGDDNAVVVAPTLPWTPIERNSDSPPPPSGILVTVGGGGTAVESLGYRPGPSFEPIVADDGASELAHVLNRRAEGLDIAIESEVAVRRVALETTGPARKAGKPTDFGPLLAGDTVEEKLAIRWWRAVEGSDPAVNPTTLTVIERRSSVAIPPISCTFSAPPTVERPTREAVTTPVIPGLPLVASALKVDLIAPLEDALLGLAQRLNRFAEGIDRTGQSARVADAPKPSFEPIDPDAGLDSGLAHELNRASEGVALVQAAAVGDDSPKTGTLVQDVQAPEASAEGEAGSPPEPPSDVGVALRLTREAVHAWVNVLSGPPAVRMSAR